MTKTNDFINISEKPITGDLNQEVQPLTPSSSFQEDDITRLYTNSPEKVSRTNQVLDIIRNNPGISAYQVKKQVLCSYTEILRIVRDLEYVGLIQTKVVLVLGRANKKLYANSLEVLK
jgi:hypothetical protein